MRNELKAKRLVLCALRLSQRNFPVKVDARIDQENQLEITPDMVQVVSAVAAFLAAVATGFAACFAAKSAKSAAASVEQQRLMIEEEEKRRLSEERLRRDQTLAAIAVQDLERAWNALTGDGSHDAPPRADRLNWLAAARLIINYKETVAEIEDESLLRKCLREERFWRHQFYLTLNTIPRHGYFPARTDPQALQDSSLIVIHNFTEWPKDETDPLDSDSTHAQALKDRSNVSIKWLALRLHLGLL